ncbi:hypothetical protein D3C83_127280 [compost metagenome]
MRFGGAAVPGTDFLADVAAEGVAGEVLSDMRVERAAMLDGCVADAQRGVDGAVGEDGVGGAGVEASSAGAAAVG